MANVELWAAVNEGKYLLGATDLVTGKNADFWKPAYDADETVIHHLTAVPEDVAEDLMKVDAKKTPASEAAKAWTRAKKYTDKKVAAMADHDLNELARAARFEEGVPADPTANMSDEDAAKWKEMNEEHRDNFKTAAIALAELERLADGCPDNLDEGECAEWEANTDKYRDVVKNQHKVAGHTYVLNVDHNGHPIANGTFDPILFGMVLAKVLSVSTKTPYKAKEVGGRKVDFVDAQGNSFMGEQTWEDALSEMVAMNPSLSHQVAQGAWSFKVSVGSIYEKGMKAAEEVLSKLATGDIPADVERYVKETKEQNPDYDDSQLWAVAWSRYCKYKNPTSDHCKKDTDEYFAGKGKSASDLDGTIAEMGLLAEGCPDNLEGADCEAWEANTDKYKDVVKNQHKVAGQMQWIACVTDAEGYWIRFFGPSSDGRVHRAQKAVIQDIERQGGEAGGESWTLIGALTNFRSPLHREITELSFSKLPPADKKVLAGLMAKYQEQWKDKTASTQDVLASMERLAGGAVEYLGEVESNFVGVILRKFSASRWQATYANAQGGSGSSGSYPSAKAAWASAVRQAPGSTVDVIVAVWDAGVPSLADPNEMGDYVVVKQLNNQPVGGGLRFAAELDGKESKFEEGVAADPTKNMSKEDAAEWHKQNDANKDNFKAAAPNPLDPVATWDEGEIDLKDDPRDHDSEGSLIPGLEDRRASLEAAWAKQDAIFKGAAAIGGLYGFTKSVQSDCEACTRKLARQATKIAKVAYGKDERTAGFLAAHAKRSGSLSAKVLVAAMQTGLGPKFARLVEAQDAANTKTAGAAAMGLYGFPAKVASLGVSACGQVEEVAGHLASDLHSRRGDRHANITGFLKSHAKEAKCLYSRLLTAAYPDAPVAKTASAPTTVAEWLTWEP